MAAKSLEGGTKRTFVSAMILLTAIMLAIPAAAMALPSESPDITPMVDGRVRAIEQVDDNIWLGGDFDQVTRRNGAVLDDDARNLAIFDSQTNEYTDVALDLGGVGTEVWDIKRYGTTNSLLIAGKFSGPSSSQRNLVRVNGNTGAVEQWYNSVSLKSVLPAPDLGKIYAGGVSLTAFDFATGDKLWTEARTSIDSTIRDKDPAPAYRDLELDPDGQTIWAACVCDFVEGERAKALVKLDTDDGARDTGWVTEAGEGAVGQAVELREGKLYLGAGGSDFVAQYGKSNNGARGWIRDTSGSTQALAIMGDQLIVGGHFFEVGNQPGDNCGKGRPEDTDGQGNPVLDPNKECERRQGIAAYSFGGALDPDWNPKYQGGYSLVWALHVEGTRLHTGGEFKTVNGVTQNSYARFSPPSL